MKKALVALMLLALSTHVFAEGEEVGEAAGVDCTKETFERAMSDLNGINNLDEGDSYLIKFDALAVIHGFVLTFEVKAAKTPAEAKAMEAEAAKVCAALH